MYSIVARARPVTRPVVATRSAARMYRASPSLAATNKVNPTSTWEEREKSAEDMDVKDHERKLIEELAKKMSLKHLTHNFKAQQNRADQAASVEVELTRQDLESHILELRKELLQEINETKDEIAELKFRIKRLESRK